MSLAKIMASVEPTPKRVKSYVERSGNAEEMAKLAAQLCSSDNGPRLVMPVGMGAWRDTWYACFYEYMKGNIEACAADDFFVNNGVFKFNPKDLHRAHEICKAKVRNALMNNKNKAVVVSNTNIKLEHMAMYTPLQESILVVRCVPPDMTTAITMGVNYWKKIPPYVYANTYQGLQDLAIEEGCLRKLVGCLTVYLGSPELGEDELVLEENK
ncbi:MAG: hypothetical protein CMB67_04340 [Euryarchaeota archaeon]|nr:hypothetical protein [Euryarchaeota archaeon]|tara:strand:+ start:3247 stop:3882 length:636 start_codon:yes stop_codon:yes gene_type:complete